MHFLFQRIPIEYDVLNVNNPSRQHIQDSSLKELIWEQKVGPRSGFFLSGQFSSSGLLLFIDFFLSLCVFSEAPMSPPPHDYDPFDSLRRGKFSDEEYQRCFRHFDSQK